MLTGESPDALIVDIGLPDADGRDVVQALRAQGETAPVIFLTARDALPDRLSGFAAGGDDYLTKPFAFAELVARLHALMRRGGATSRRRSGSFGSIPARTLPPAAARPRISPRPSSGSSPPRGEAWRRRPAPSARRGRWAHGAIVHDNTLDVYIARLRRKLEPLPGAPEIATVHGVGYSLR